ncbi:MAG: hypothetical protein ACKV22_27115 [Bryobacteraceae bacterium]
MLSILLEREKLHCVWRLLFAQALYNEFRNFKVKVRPNGRWSLGGFRDGTHDDLVMSVALACWYARKLWPDSFTPPFRSQRTFFCAGCSWRLRD